MRYVSITSLKEGMIVGKNLYDINNNLLLGKGSVIQRNYINRILELGYPGIYIEDDISKDIEIQDVISDELRMKAVKTIKDVFITTQSEANKEKKLSTQKIDETKKLIYMIVEQILDNKDAIVNLIDLKVFDDYTFYHSVNVAVLSLVIGSDLGLNNEEMYQLGLGAILHDIGKLFIDINLLNKKEKLTTKEYEHIMKHSEYGYEYLKESYGIPSAAYIGVLQHHEKYDGTGYPNRKVKGEISVFGKIIGIADVYDALTSNRPYRKSLSPSEAMEYIMANGGRMFDLKLTKIFVRKVAPYPIGTNVFLSNGFEGIVVKNYEEACLRPRVKAISDLYGNKIEPIYFHLKDDREVRNVTIIGHDAKILEQT